MQITCYTFLFFQSSIDEAAFFQQYQNHDGHGTCFHSNANFQVKQHLILYYQNHDDDKSSNAPRLHKWNKFFICAFHGKIYPNNKWWNSKTNIKWALPSFLKQLICCVSCYCVIKQSGPICFVAAGSWNESIIGFYGGEACSSVRVRVREKASQKIRAKGGVARKKRARAARGKTTTVIAFPTERKLGSSNKI